MISNAKHCQTFCWKNDDPRKKNTSEQQSKQSVECRVCVRLSVFFNMMQPESFSFPHPTWQCSTSVNLMPPTILRSYCSQGAYCHLLCKIQFWPCVNCIPPMNLSPIKYINNLCNEMFNGLTWVALFTRSATHIMQCNRGLIPMTTWINRDGF